MNDANWNKRLTLLANIAVVAGIIFLGIEVRQNTQTLEQNALYMRLALMDVGYQQTADWRNMLVADKDVGDLWEKGCRTELDQQEAADYNYLSGTWLVQHRNLYDRARVLGGGKAADLMAESTASRLYDCPILRGEFSKSEIHHVISPVWHTAVVDALARMDHQEQVESNVR